MPLPIKIIFAPHAASLMQFKNVSGAPQASTQTSKPLPFVNSSQVVCKSHSLLKAFFASSTTNEKVSYEPVMVRYVVDGDTLTVTDEDGSEFKVRRIGCNTPESVSSDENKNCEEGRLASQYTKSLFSEGQTVYLEYDNECCDKYGRILAYVWLSEPTEKCSDDYMKKKYMLNAKLLSDGQTETAFVVEIKNILIY